MGLLLTLPKEYNCIYTDFPKAYWSIESILYTPDAIQFALVCYPSRDAKYKKHQRIEGLPFGAPVNESYTPELYTWMSRYPLKDVFPNGIPVDENEQKTILYNFLRTVNTSPFKDVFEEEKD